MLLAPIVLNEPRHDSTPYRRVRPAPSTTSASLRARRWVGAWFAVGALLLCLVPALRNSALLGNTAAFWLIGAPLLDLAWLARKDLAARFVASVKRKIGRPRRNAARRVPRQCVASLAAPST